MLIAQDRQLRDVLYTTTKRSYDFLPRTRPLPDLKRFHTSERPQALPLWVEYARMDAGFYLPGGEGFSESFARPFSRGGTAWFMEDTDVLYLTARQQWGENFSTFQSYARYESGPSQYSRSWAVGLGYRYRPGLYMEVSLSDQDGALDNPDYTDRKVRVRTMISF